MKVTAYLATGICLLFVLARAQQPRTTIKIDPATFDVFVGQYRFIDNPDLVVSFFRDGDTFFAQPSTQSKVEIFPEADGLFFVKAIDAQVTFTRDAQGIVTGLDMRQNNQTTRAEKISSQPLIQEQVAFEKRDEMIRMRDGVRLHTLIFAPRGRTDRLPILFNRTPYGIGEASSDSINQGYREFLKDGYVFVLQDIRGRYGSEGEFLMNRPLRTGKDSRSIDESTDTYDTIEWLIKNVPNNNGRVGMIGVSYDGWLAAVGTIDAHPALKASSPQAPMTDTYLGDDFFHNGAFRQSYGYEYVKAMESSKRFSVVVIDRDAYDWYLGLGSLAKITAEAQGRWPTWNAFVNHPNYDEYWKARAAQRYLKETSVATLVVGG